MKTVVFSLLIVCVFSQKSFCQQNDLEAAGYNLGIGSIMGGIGAIVNKSPDEKWSKALLKGMGQGAVGGLALFGSKKLIGNIQSERNWYYGWGANVLYAAGSSIIENAASGQNWNKWHLVIGFNRLEFDTKENKLQYKVMPVALAGTVYISFWGKLELKRSLQTGFLIFSTDDNTRIVKLRIAFTFINTPLLSESHLENYQLYSHELIHVLQYQDFNGLTGLMNKPIAKWREESSTFNVISQWVYYDFQEIVSRSLYLLENINRSCYYDNFFEHEAGYYARELKCK